jgi:hypothetical protein
MLHLYASTRNNLMIISSGVLLSAPDGSSPRGYSRMFSNIVSKIDSCIVGANRFSIFLSFFIRKSPYSIFIECIFGLVFSL